MTTRLVFLALAIAVHSAASDGPPAPKIPLCAGLTIVTAVNQMDGDYESIKTIESIADTGVRLKYSAERLVEDWLSNDPPKLQKFTVNRTIRKADLANATLYLQQFSSELPELIPETTAIGTSTTVLNALKTKGAAEIGIFIPFSQQKPSTDRNEHPNVYDNQMVATVQRAGTTPVSIPVVVNDVRVNLPAIHATGEFYGDKSAFFFLDDPANPLALKFRIGIDAILPEDAELAKQSGRKPQPGGDKETLQVIKISHHCADATTVTDLGTGAVALERALSQSGRAEIYNIFFTFNSDQIRGESEPTLKDIADVLVRHPDWQLSVEGHTDNIAGDAYNLDLSKRRAAAVKDALVKRHRVADGRLAPAGLGESQPKDSNDTLEGRARNRRVELVKR